MEELEANQNIVCKCLRFPNSNFSSSAEAFQKPTPSLLAMHRNVNWSGLGGSTLKVTLLNLPQFRPLRLELHSVPGPKPCSG